MNSTPSPSTDHSASDGSSATSQVAVPLKYAYEIKHLSGCPEQPTYANVGIAYRFAQATVEHQDNFLPIARLQPLRVAPGGKPVVDCCEAWSLSMFTTLSALQAKAKKVCKTSPKFLKRVGEFYTQVKLTPQCGVHTQPNSSGHFEFFERATFDGVKAVIHHEKLGI